MRFDFTNGKKACYIVHIYGKNVNDSYYTHHKADAKMIYRFVIVEPETEVALYDMRTGETIERKRGN